MTNETPHFGLAIKENPFAEYIGKYVQIKRQGMSIEGGLLTNISEDGHGILNPFVYLGYTLNGIYHACLKNENLYVPLREATIVPETLEGLQGFCYQLNERSFTEFGNKTPRLIIVSK